MPPPVELLPEIVRLAQRAGDIVLRHYEQGTEVREKADASPVTAADEAAEREILAGLREIAPDVPVIAEERVAAGEVPGIGDGPFWLVDPLDGTREFLSRNGEFTVNIALIENRRPVIGVVLAPALGQIWWGRADAGAFARKHGDVHQIWTRVRPGVGAIAVASRSHRDPETDAFLEREGVSEIVSAGSSLKFCRIAEGEADVYPRFGRTMEWDTAAGHAVLRAAGGRVTTVDGEDFLYGKPGFENPAFIARGA